MAPLSPSNTPRVYYTYQNEVSQHTLVIRLASPDGNLADADAAVGALLSACGNLFGESTIVAVEQSSTGDNIRHPVASDRIGDVFGSGSVTKDTNPISLTFTGRSIGGHKGRLSLFGYKEAISQYRLLPSERTEIATALAALAAAEGAPAAIDGEMMIWHQYANIKPNDHWVKKSRVG